MICPNCHDDLLATGETVEASEIGDDALFCSECGQKIIKVKEPEVKENSTVGSRIQNKKNKKQDSNKKTMIIAGVIVAIVIVVVTCFVCYFLFFRASDDSSTSSGEETTSEKKDTKIELEETSLTLKVGETEYIEANMDCKYTVKDETICEVDSFGTVKGLKAGKTTVKCEGENGTTVTCKITVEEIAKNNEISYDVVNEVKKIKELYNDTQEHINSYSVEKDNNMTFYKDNDNLKKVVVNSDSDWNYTREYFFEKNNIYFVFIYGNNEEYRYYFKDGIMIRYIDTVKNVYDYGNIFSYKWDRELNQEIEKLSTYSH